MGTRYNIVIANPSKTTIDPKAIKETIEDTLLSLNNQVSTYIPNSTISQFNLTQKTEWVTVDKELFLIVEAAQKISQQSLGAFDISISPLIELWGFGVRKSEKIPSKSEIEIALSNSGYRLLSLNEDNQTFKKAKTELKIDLSAIAKGYAVDKISELLKKSGYNNHLVEIGGELKVNGLNHNNKKWRIAIEQPDRSIDPAQNGLEITNRAVATSGDYRNYFVEKGIRRSHIIDPKTGYPIKHKLASVTVLHQSTMLADAYATAILVMGEVKGKTFVEQNNLDVLMIIRKEDSFEFWSSFDL